MFWVKYHPWIWESPRRLITNSNNRKTLKNISHSSTNTLKEEFARFVRAENNWRKGKAINNMHFKSGHPYLSSIYYDNEYFITARKSIKVWSRTTTGYFHYLTLDIGNQKHTKCLQVNGETLVTGGKYGVKLVNIKDKQDTVINDDDCYALNLDSNRLLHGAFNHIHYSDLNTGQVVHTFKGHPSVVKAVCREDNLFVSGCWRETRLWDIRSKDLSRVYVGGIKRNCCEMENNMLVYSHGRQVQFWEVRMHRQVVVLSKNVNSICVEGQKSIIITNTNDADIFDMSHITEPKLSSSLPLKVNEDETVTCVKSFCRKLIVGTTKGNVYAWEF